MAKNKKPENQELIQSSFFEQQVPEVRQVKPVKTNRVSLLGRRFSRGSNAGVVNDSIDSTKDRLEEVGAELTESSGKENKG